MVRTTFHIAGLHALFCHIPVFETVVVYEMLLQQLQEKANCCDGSTVCSLFNFKH